MRNIVAGQGYTPIGVFPAIVYHYPPVFHVTSAALAKMAEMDELVAGRLVSLLSTIAMIGLVAALTARAVARGETRAMRLATALLAALILASCYPIAKWSTTMRVDMLETALSLAGLLLAILAATRPRMILPAAIAFVLAIYTKQTAVAAPAAAFVGLLVVRPRAAWGLMLSCIMLGTGALAWLVWSTNGGFLRHTMLYNINRLDLSRWQDTALIFMLLAAFIALSFVGAWATGRRLLVGQRGQLGVRAAADPSQTAALILLVFLIIKTLMLPMMLKSGSSDNYLIEWLCAVAIFAGIALLPMLHIASGRSRLLSVPMGLLVIIGVPLQAWMVPSFAVTPQTAHSEEEAMALLVSRIRASSKPVISDDMVLLIRAGRPVLWEPAIAAELGHSGQYDERAFAAMVCQHRFGFFITRGDRGEASYDSRYNPIVADAIDAAYPRRERTHGLVLHLPAS
jgi:4-amino-4-deoxy-L-arabinose transferase-like glycosyltransferase